MRGYLTAIAALVSALPAAASSIETVTAPVTRADSITVISCSACPPLQDRGRVLTYIVPQLEPGRNRTALKTIYGQEKLVRTEAWLGGSPVNLISAATESALRMARASGDIPPAPLHARAAGEPAKPVVAQAETRVLIGVDTQMTTAALETPATAAMTAVPGKTLSSRNFDGQSFELRLD